MCGIVAYSGNTAFDPEKIKILFLYNDTRGGDSAGFYANYEDSEFDDRIEKVLGKAADKLVPHYSFDPTTVLIGHTRNSSRGNANDVRNAHPFLQGDYVGVHNGTFTNFIEVREAFEILPSQGAVDSKVFYSVLNKTNDIHETLGYFKGGAALVYTKKGEEDTLFVFRNEERPLFRGTIKGENGELGVYISSMEEALKAINCTNIKKFSEGKLYTIKAGEVTHSNKGIKYKPLPEIQDSMEDILYKFDIIEEYDRESVSKESSKHIESHYRLHTFADGTVGVAEDYNSFYRDIKKELIVYCKVRKDFFYRVYYGYNAATDIEKMKMMEFKIPRSLVGKGTPNKISAIHKDLEGTANLMYVLYGELYSYQMAVEALVQKYNIPLEEIETISGQAILTKMESFLGIAID